MKIPATAIMAAALLAGAYALSLVLTAIVTRSAKRLGLVAYPQNERFHTTITPLGGGIAIFWTVASFTLIGTALVKFAIEPNMFGYFKGTEYNLYTSGYMSQTGSLICVLVAALALHILGLIDDKKSLNPIIKLVCQILVATFAAVMAGIRVELFIYSKIITIALSVIWIVLIINAFNFLDNMDGLSAGIAFIASTILLATAALSGQYLVSALALVFIGALLGFLTFNFPPAKIFMGDSGSMVVGFFVALLTLKTNYYYEGHSSNTYAVLMPLIVLAVPLYDFISVTLLRLKQGKSPFVGDTQHFSHRLNKTGLSVTQAVLTMYLATLCTSIGALLLTRVNIIGSYLIFAQTVMVLAIIAILEYAMAPQKQKNIADQQHQNTGQQE